MKRGIEDKARGTFHEVKGSVKQKVGQATNNRGMEARGAAEKIAGKVQKKVGQVEKVLGA